MLLPWPFSVTQELLQDENSLVAEVISSSMAKLSRSRNEGLLEILLENNYYYSDLEMKIDDDNKNQIMVIMFNNDNSGKW